MFNRRSILKMLGAAPAVAAVAATEASVAGRQMAAAGVGVNHIEVAPKNVWTEVSSSFGASVPIKEVLFTDFDTWWSQYGEARADDSCFINGLDADIVGLHVPLPTKIRMQRKREKQRQKERDRASFLRQLKREGKVIQTLFNPDEN